MSASGHHRGDALGWSIRRIGAAGLSLAVRSAPHRPVTRILSQSRATLAVVAVWRYADTTGSGDGCNSGDWSRGGKVTRNRDP